MTEKEFYKKFKGVNCPLCRGAKHPPFNPAKINENRFADELRFKTFNIAFEECKDGVDTVNVKWESQDWDASGINGVVAEIIRCFGFIGFVGNVVLDIWERGEKGSGEYEAHREFTVG